MEPPVHLFLAGEAKKGQHTREREGEWGLVGVALRWGRPFVCPTRVRESLPDNRGGLGKNVVVRPLFVINRVRYRTPFGGREKGSELVVGRGWENAQDESVV